MLILAGLTVCLIPVIQEYGQSRLEDFYGNIKKLSLYDTGVEVKFGDTFLHYPSAPAMYRTGVWW